MKKITRLLEGILQKITPTATELKKEKALAEKIMKQIREIEGEHIDTMLCGSIARNTHLRGDNDLDIFVLFHEQLGREEFEKEGLRIGKRIFRGKEWEKAFSEHPYIRGVIEDYDVEIVPSYKVSSAELLQSAVDRSPFHCQFLKKTLNQKHLPEIRLLKQFLKGIKAYGADTKSNSVPGYVVELLILRYGTFLDAIKTMAKWKQNEVIDIGKYYQEGEAKKKFGSSALVIIDPVDRNRNVAAALSLNQFSRIVAASRAFLKRPNRDFFFGKVETPWPIGKIKKMLLRKELIAVRLGYPKGALPDVIWGQIQRFCRKTENHITENEFKVLRSEAWTDEKNIIVMVFEVEDRTLQETTKKIGPFVTDEANCKAFLKAHKRIISGPRIENGRLVIEVPRKYTSIEKLLHDFLKKEKKEEKEQMRKAINKMGRVLEEKNLIELYRQNKDFAKFFTAHLKGEEEFYC